MITTLEETIDAVDHLAGAADFDSQRAAILLRCRESLAALCWERFRLRHEALSRQATAAHARAAFVQRHRR